MDEQIDNEIDGVRERRDDAPTISDYRMRWFGIFVVILLGGVLVGAVIRANPHHPTIDWPDSGTAELRYTGSKPIDPEYLDELIKAYKLDEPCVVGEKYGAVCEDGEVMHNAEPGVCADNGGVKEWITCK